MVTINENLYPPRLSPTASPPSTSNDKPLNAISNNPETHQKVATTSDITEPTPSSSSHMMYDSNDRSAFNPNTFMHFRTSFSSQSSLESSSVNNAPVEGEDEIKLSDYIIEDVPLLVSDDEEMSEDEESRTSKSINKDKLINEIKSQNNTTDDKKINEPTNVNPTPTPTTSTVVSATTTIVAANNEVKKVETTKTYDYDFQFERKQLMTIVVKYISTKITNSFPPDTPHKIKPNELPLDKFLLILVSRLQLSLPDFMKGVIYLFRYMDIIYLLRYLNQSNNFANYNEMDFGLKKLIIGCFKLVLIRERKSKDVNWFQTTQLPNNDINKVVKTIIGRLNNKISIKEIELVKLKLEIFRFVKMVTKRV